MFTGIVEELGSVIDRTGSRLRIGASLVLDGVKLGAPQWPAGTDHSDEHFGTVKVYFDQVELPIDLARDSLELYPMIYYAVPRNAKALPPAAVAKVNAYLRAGGAFIVDTRDAAPGRDVSQNLQQLLAGIDAPPLQPAPAPMPIAPHGFSWTQASLWPCTRFIQAQAMGLYSATGSTMSCSRCRQLLASENSPADSRR